MIALTIACVGDAVPVARRGSAIGLLGTMSAIGTTMGPLLGGLLIAQGSVRGIFLVTVPFGALTFILLQRALPADQRDGSCRPALDVAGTALLICTLSAYALAMTVGHGVFGLLNVSLALAAVGAGAMFLAVERRAAAPLLPWGRFTQHGLGLGLSANALVSAVMMTTLVVGPFYLSGALGLSGVSVGLLLAVGPLVAALTGLPAGRLVDRYGTRPTSIAGLIAIAAGATSLSLSAATFSIIGYVGAIIVVTAGYGVFQTSNMTAIIAGVRSAERGMISGMISLARNLGLVTGASAMGAVFAFGSSVADIATAGPPAIAAGIRVTFAVAASLVIVALALTACTREESSAR